MEIVVVSDKATGSRLVADAICRLVIARPECSLGFATGSTPEDVYAELTARRGVGAVSFDRARVFQLDEYVGLPLERPESYRSVLAREVSGPLGIAPERAFSLDGMAADVVATSAEYEAAIARAGGIDLQLLGLGTDGHIAFNEPGSSLASRTRLTTLTLRTRRDNSRFFGGNLDAVPRHGLTQGIGTIMEARHLILLAWGDGKARVVAAAVEGPISTMVPASAVQMHPHVTIVVDEFAASSLELRDYYEAAWTAKPGGQTI